MRSRAVRLLTLLSLLAAPLVVASSTQSSQAGGSPGTYMERWCGVGVPKPCLLSVKRGPDFLTVSDPNFAVESTGQQSVSGFPYFAFQVAEVGAIPLSQSDTWEFLFDTGGIDPRYSEAFAGAPDVDRIDDGDGTFKVRYTAKPILYTTGCDQGELWPYPCPSAAATEDVMLQVEIQERTDEFVRFHRSQSPESVNGIFLEAAPDGSRYLESEMVNSRFRTDGTTLYNGEVRFRIPYTMLRDSFGVPDPSTMDGTSLSGTVNGGTTIGDFTVWHDPDGGGMFVDITNLRFPPGTLARAQAVTVPKRVIRVKRGVIVPRMPKNLVAIRIDAHTGKVGFTKAVARGALPTGYKIRCVSGGGHVVTNTKTTATSPIRIGGLRKGVGYDCRVRATSKAGPGVWSVVVRVRARP